LVLSFSDLSDSVDSRSDLRDIDDGGADDFVVLPFMGSVLVTAMVCFWREIEEGLGDSYGFGIFKVS
jgi:hypothetical protein